MNKYINLNLYPEVSVFNMDGVSNCLKLNKIFPGKFFVCVYLGYPSEVAATLENIKIIGRCLKGIDKVFYTVYKSFTNEQIDSIIEVGGHLRFGMEDQTYFNGEKIESMVKYTQIIHRKIHGY